MHVFASLHPGKALAVFKKVGVIDSKVVCKLGAAFVIRIIPLCKPERYILTEQSEKYHQNTDAREKYPPVQILEKKTPGRAMIRP